MIIATGTPESHETPLPIDASATPGVQQPTAIQPGQLSGPTYPGAVVSYAAQVSGVEADVRAAQLAGQQAEHGRRDFYAHDMVQSGPAEYGLTMDLPEVPAFAVPAVQSYEYLGTGDEPVQAG